MATLVTRYVNAGSSGGDGTTQALSGASAAYASLSAWNTARVRNLVSADEIEEVICEGSTPDTTIVSLTSSWVTDATRYVSIKAGPNDRAGTKWNTSKYSLTHAPSGGQTLFTSVVQYIRIDGIQFGSSVVNHNAATRFNITINLGPPAASASGSDNRLSNCYIKHYGASPFSTLTTSDYPKGLYYAPSTNGASPVPIGYFWNNIVSYEVTGVSNYGSFAPRGIRAEFRDHICYVYNNTVVGAWATGISGDNDTSRFHHLRNNLISGATAATIENANRCDYNATNLSSLGYTANTHDRVSQTFSFVAADDFTLTSSDAGAKDFGVSDPGSGLFSDDILRITRSGTWDIGAHEYASSRRRIMIVT